LRNFHTIINHYQPLTIINHHHSPSLTIISVNQSLFLKGQNWSALQSLNGSSMIPSTNSTKAGESTSARESKPRDMSRVMVVMA
jgi:hypothetical protein